MRMKIETQLRKVVLLLEQNKFLESKSLLETINPEFFEEEFFNELNDHMTNRNYGLAQCSFRSILLYTTIARF